MTWDEIIFTREGNQDFLTELADLDSDDLVEAVADALALGTSGDKLAPEEVDNSLLAATIAALWAGAPIFAGELVEEHPFIRDLRGSATEEMQEMAAAILDNYLDSGAEEDELDSYRDSLP